MTLSFKLNGYHDIEVSKKGVLKTITGSEEVRQRVIVSLLHYWREYFLNVPAGVPWYEVILGSRDLRMAESILRSTVLDVPGVVGVVDLSVFFSSSPDRRVTVSTIIETEGAITQNILVTTGG